MRTTATHLTASLLAACCLAGCGGSDRGADATRSPAADSLPAPTAAVRTTGAVAVDSSVVPVRVGGEEDFDACGGTAETIGPVAIRRGPGEQFAVVEQLGAKAQVYACDISPDQRWDGVVIVPANEAEDCGVSAPITTRQAYSGPCQSGWVQHDSVVVVAG